VLIVRLRMRACTSMRFSYRNLLFGASAVVGASVVVCRGKCIAVCLLTVFKGIDVSLVPFNIYH